MVRTIRRTVRRIEAEWEQELGPSQFAQLRELLIDLNATSIVRGQFHGPRTGTASRSHPPPD